MFKIKKSILGKKNKKSRFSNRFGSATLGIIFFLFILAIGLLLIMNNTKSNLPIKNPLTTLPIGTRVNQVAAFSSVDDFKTYLESVHSSVGITGDTMMFNSVVATPETRDLAVEDYLKGPADLSTNDQATGAGRVSTTNVQVTGIDEPDIVKTDGQNIYFSPEPTYGIYRDVMPMMIDVDAKIMPPQPISAKTNIIKAWPIENLEILSKIDKAGELLVWNKILAVFSGQEIVAYDFSDPAKPSKKWTIKLDDNNYLQTARLYKDKIYLVTQSYINDYQPCPLKPLSSNGTTIEIACNEIYHPIEPVAVDSNFSALTVDFQSGEIKNKVSFVGLNSQSIVYMSTESLYITYQQDVDMFSLSQDFLTSKMTDLVPAEVLNKLAKIKNYDISQSSKMSEYYNILSKWQNSLDKDQRLKIENEMSNRMEDYFQAHKRDLSSTGIVKIALDNFSIKANGIVPGRPLNQFSLDEYNDHLRLATTVGESWWGSTSPSTANDVYVLDKNLKISGKIEDLGLSERIYSARFIEDKGYLVTFRQTDPFYVLDLSDPKNPQKKGELKIPGFSSYLHPLAKNKILGIGREDSKVKLSYFDVSDPQNPKEIDKYLLDEYWTDVSDNHHAFLQDAKHQIFFLPATRGGYVFSYQNDKLSLAKAISLQSAKRAVYLNDYLYVLAADKLRVFDENSWEELDNLDIEE